MADLEEKIQKVLTATLKAQGLDVEEDIQEYLAGLCHSILEEATDRDSAETELLEALEPQLEAAGAGQPQLKALCVAVSTASFGAPKPKAQAKSAGGGASAKAGGKNEETLVHIKNLLLMYGGSSKALLNHTSLELKRNHRYGIVGQNGAGKTTLFQALLSGAIKELPSHLSIVHVHGGSVMESGDPDMSAVDYAKLRRTELGVTSGSAEEALKSVGFVSEMQVKALRELSGGWRMRLALACAMMKSADVLLLDEPTNHLDTSAVEWLSKYCSGLPGTCLIISHEPDFLDSVCTDIIHFDAQKLNFYEGNFSKFLIKASLNETEAQLVLETKSKPSLATAGKAIQGQQEDVKLMFPIPGKLDGVTNGVKPILEAKNISFSYTEGGKMILDKITCKLSLSSRVAIVGVNGAGKSTLLSVMCGESAPTDNGGVTGEVQRHRNLRLSYIAQHHTFHLEEFLKCTPVHYFQIRFRGGFDEQLQKRLTEPANDEERQLRKELAQRHGKYGRAVANIVGRQKRGKDIYYEVEWEGLNDSKQNTFETVAKLKLMHQDGQARAFDERHAAQACGVADRPLTEREIKLHLENFQFTEEMCTKRMLSSFSGGQKCRLMLAAAFWTKPHVIALDEPTNYLDPETVSCLAKALKNFRGGVITVTHSQPFVDEVCTEEWLLADSKLTPSKLAPKIGTDDAPMDTSMLKAPVPSKDEAVASADSKQPTAAAAAAAAAAKNGSSEVSAKAAAKKKGR